VGIMDIKFNIKSKDLKANLHRTEEEIKAELEMVEAAKKDPEMFQGLYDTYFEAIFNYVFRRTGEEEVTADIVSQTFYNALIHIKKYSYRGVPFSAWLYKIAGNEINLFYKKSKRTPTFSIEEPILMNLIEEVEEDSNHEETVAKLTEELKNLSTEDLTILELRFFEDKCFKEIAYILEIGESSAKMRTYRAIEKLRSVMLKERRGL
jgi:RNA polymerase sigma-70 factor, ECF subfamily